MDSARLAGSSLLAAASLASAAPAQCPPVPVQEIVEPLPHAGTYFARWADANDTCAVLASWTRADVYDGPPFGAGGLVELQTEAGASVGGPVAMTSDRVVVGATIFERDPSGEWVDVQTLAVSSVSAVATDGDLVVVARVSCCPGPVVHVYEEDASGYWNVVGMLFSPTGSGQFGAAVAVRGSTIAVGSPLTLAPNQEASVCLFERDPTSLLWKLDSVVVSPDPTQGCTGCFGSSVALQGNTLVVGDPRHVKAGSPAGAAYVFEQVAGVWILMQRLEGAPADPAVVTNQFGTSLALDGDALLVGTVGATVLDPASFLFERYAGRWGQLAELFAAPQQVATPLNFGADVAVAGERVLITAPSQAPGSPGAAYAYDAPASQPVSVYCTAGVSSGGCRASMRACGFASASAPSGFDLFAYDVEGSRRGTFFFGTNGRQGVPWGNGTSYRCVVPPVRRGPSQDGVAAAGTCGGTLTLDLNARWEAVPASNPGAGATVQAQLWYRDPTNTSNRSTAFSDAVEFLVAP